MKNCAGWILINTEMRAFLNENGDLTEIDSRKHFANLTNTLSRYEESYHEKVGKFEANGGVATIHSAPISKEKGLEKLLHYDDFERLNFQDFVMPKGISMKAFFENGIGLKPLQYTHNDETIFESIEQEIIKKIGVSETEVFVNYLSESMGNDNFGTAFNFFFPGGHENLRINGENSLKKQRIFNGNNLILKDEWCNIELELLFSSNVEIWFSPIETVSLSESGFEKIFQGFCLLPHWNFSETNQRMNVKLRIK